VKRFGLLDGSVVIQCGRALDWVFVYVVYVFFQIEFFLFSECRGWRTQQEKNDEQKEDDFKGVRSL
jgi:hypothetical protein